MLPTDLGWMPIHSPSARIELTSLYFARVFFCSIHLDKVIDDVAEGVEPLARLLHLGGQRLANLPQMVLDRLVSFTKPRKQSS